MYGALDISTSGLIAQRTRLEVVSANIANAGTPLDADGAANPFKRRLALLAPGGDGRDRGSLGVHVREIALDDSPPKPKYDPGNPLAATESDPARGIEKGYVYYPNIDKTIEQLNGMEAVRAYEANVAVAEAAKTMMAAALQLLA